MGTLNGFGTQFYDWVHLDNGQAEATSWLVAAFFPIVPLRRVRLRVHTSGEKPSFFSLNSGDLFRSLKNSAVQTGLPDDDRNRANDVSVRHT